MNVSKKFYNRKCDACGALLDDGTWHDEEKDLTDVAAFSGWKHLDGRDYCPDCWDNDVDGNIVTRDGRKFSGSTYERIREGVCLDELGEKTVRQLTAILLIDKLKAWFDGLSEEEKEAFAREHPEFVIHKKEGGLP